MTHTYEDSTDGILVRVQPEYVPDRSSPPQGYFFFTYTITVHNQSSREVQLLHRHWIITDGHGRIEEVTGPGVIGLQPEIKPGGEFTYTSACPLSTPTGNMRGTYEMKDSDGRRFQIRIPVFFLRAADIFH
jgi:ApaG protein